MKCQIPEISWHNRDPVLSVDIQPKSANDRDPKYRLASGGTDSHVLIWYMTQNPECGTITLDLAADLTRHQRAVNAVRWSPSGELLASADDESVIFIWKQKGETEIVNILDTVDEQDKETWLTLKILRGHMEDVYDLSWSANSLFLASGSVDNTAIVWDVMRGKSQAILHDHKGFVQGVAWDPKDKYLATLSTDRYFRVFDIQTKRVIARCNKCTLPVPKTHPLRDKTVRLFHDDTLQTFFRRLSFSPDGNLVVCPSGVAEVEGVPKPLNTTYIFTRNSFRQPAITLPSPDQYTVAVRFCPVFFELHPYPENKPPTIPLPYRMIFALATKSSVYLYDTQQKAPFALISNIHYTRLTDLSWSSDGKILIVSSTDGFCSLIFFADDELGKVYDGSTNSNPAESSSAGTKEKTPPKTSSNCVDKVVPSRKNGNEKEKVAQPIAFRRKTKPPAENNQATVVASAVTPEAGPSVQPEPASTGGGVEYIIEKDKIISSAEKFESPSKKDRPVTPIAVRRHPRTPSDTASNDSHPSPAAAPQPSASSSSAAAAAAGSSVGKKAAKPIAIRRHPRALTVDPVKPSVEPTAEEDANDTWPIDQPKPVAKQQQAKLQPPSDTFQMEVDQTEDIMLVVVSDDDDDIGLKQQEAEETKEPANSGDITVETAGSPKTPRRVEFRTISTPKSKKKIL
ncbi:chromatin assembly factor 1 subunit B [Anopheles ziemanni]|uniref:chromatin assembly factor 1 subunit B n=1 Tax=Anopheles coustani TaxID=139045 RepID=UPI002659AFD8|nr:chromatin assembly factor 1 subunit B [Anopheles coustani]XP_058167740.1 chromatin assembly factor 1 subunit B [Anopheles ziemanni]